MEPTPTPVVVAPAAAERPAPEGFSRQAKLGFALVAVFALAALFWPRGAPNAAPAGMLFDAGGRPMPLGSRMAPVTLVHFWATWCPPCLTEIPSILRLEQDYHLRPGFSLVMIAVSDENDKVKTFLGEAIGENLFDDWKVARSYGTEKLPETHLVVDGKVVHSFIGATDWDDPDVRRRIDDALAATAKEG